MNHTLYEAREPVAHPAPAPLPTAGSLLLLAPRLIAATFNSGAQVFRLTFDGSYDREAERCPGFHEHHPGESCCLIPETDCPSPCVCHIQWQGCPGDSFRYQIKITNSSKAKRDYTLKPEPFSCSEEVVAVSPANKTLAPGQSFTAIASFTIPEAMAGGRYQGVIRLNGAYEQLILVSLAARPRNACCCHIEQGEIPKKIRAHHWFHHFQCEQPCFPPSEKEGG